LVFDAGGLGLVEPIELRVVRQLAWLDEAGVILLDVAVLARGLPRLEQRLPLLREDEDIGRLVIDRDPRALDQALLRQPVDVAVPDVARGSGLVEVGGRDDAKGPDGRERPALGPTEVVDGVAELNRLTDFGSGQ